MRRSLVQVVVGPPTDLAGRRVSGRAPGPGLAALLLVTAEEFLQTGVSGHESYLAAEWVTLAACAPTLGRRSAWLCGAALALALVLLLARLPVALGAPVAAGVVALSISSVERVGIGFADPVPGLSQARHAAAVADLIDAPPEPLVIHGVASQGASPQICERPAQGHAGGRHPDPAAAVVDQVPLSPVLGARAVQDCAFAAVQRFLDWKP